MTMFKPMLFASTIAVTVLASQAQALTPAWKFTTETNLVADGSWNLGQKFLATNFWVTHLGYYDDLGNGFAGNQTHDVALYDNFGSLLRSATVTSTDPLIGHWRWASVTPVMLDGIYHIHGASGSDSYTSNTIGFATAPTITILGNSKTGGTTPDFVGSGSYPFSQFDGFWGANIASVPEPASWAMLIAGFGLTGAVMRRRRAFQSVAA